MSLCSVIGNPWTCSGLMYSTVPMTTSLRVVKPISSNIFAIPKSSTFSGLPSPA